MQHHQKQTARQRYFRQPKVQQWNGLIDLRVADDGECVLFAVVRESETGPFAVTQYAPFRAKPASKRVRRPRRVQGQQRPGRKVARRAA